MVVGNNADLISEMLLFPYGRNKVRIVQGYIETRTIVNYGWFMLNPVYADDIQYGESAPNISNVLRDKGVVAL